MSTMNPVWHRSLPSVATGALVVVIVLYVAKPIVVPLALALLLSFVLTPVVTALQKAGMKRIAAVSLTVLLSFATIAGVGYVVAQQITGLAAEIPKHKEEIRQKVSNLVGRSDGPFGELLRMVQDLTESPTTPAPNAPATPKQKEDGTVQPVVVVQPKESGMARAIEAIVPVVEPLATAGLVVILVIFMLGNREDLRDRLIALAGHGHLSGTTRAMEDAATRVGKYLLSLLLVNIAFGILFSIGLWLIGVPFAFLWGFLAAVLRFIPFLGTWAAAAFPVLLSVALAPDWAQPLKVLAFFIVIDLVTANAVEPLIFGHGTGVSPIALLVAAAFWAWIWGPIGLLLATPLTVCLVVLGSHVPRLGFLAVLLGNAPALQPPARLYQRLFARDRHEAGERLTEFVAANGVETAFDEMVIPALRIARRDRKNGGLTPEGEDFAIAATRELIAEVGSRDNQVAPEPTIAVVACPAHHPAEEPTLDMLGLLLRHDGASLQSLPARELSSAVVERVEAVKPSAVFISIMPPGGVPQAAHLCRVLRKRFPTLKIVVGWWGTENNFDKLLVKLRKAGASYVTTSLKQSRSQLRFVAEVSTAQVSDDMKAPAGVGS